MTKSIANSGPTRRDALLVVHVQNDFLPGGSLAVPEGDKVIPLLNRYIAHFKALELPIIATRDWHPPDHCSFRAQGGPWPPHCIAGTEGAAFAKALGLPDTTPVISQATRPDKEAYSSFEGTSLEIQLLKLGVRCVFVGGLATDYCVLNTVLDALKAGFHVVVLKDAIRAVDVHPGDGVRALELMQSKGASLATIEDFS